MKPDWYIKIVLSIIAGCLVVLTLRDMDFIPVAHAEKNPPAPPEYLAVPINPDGTVDVNIRKIEDRLNVNIEQIGGYGCYNGIPVVVKGN